MSGPRIIGVVGNPRPESRTHQLSRVLARELAQVIPGAVTSEVDLAPLGGKVLDPADPDAAAALERALTADVLVVASPTYKASYSGLLKGFLDRLGHRGLAGKAAIPVLLGGLPGHSLAVDAHLTPLLLELGAIVPARGLFVLEPEVSAFGGFAAEWAARYGPVYAAAVAASQFALAAP